MMRFLQNIWTAYGINIAVFLAILLFTILIAKIIKRLMIRKKKFVRVDTTQYRFLTHFITGIIYFFGLILAIYSIPPMRGFAVSIFASSGVLAIIIGFASQQAFSNIVSGIFIALFKPFRIGDRLRLVGKEFYGIVEDISLRHTVIRTFEHKRIVVPNSVISAEILENDNIVDLKILKFWEIGISYDSDVQKAIKIIQEEVMKHPDFFDNPEREAVENQDEPVTVRVLGFGESSINLRAYVWAKDPTTAFRMACDLNESVKARFDAEGIEIPFPYRTVVFKNKLTHSENK